MKKLLLILSLLWGCQGIAPTTADAPDVEGFGRKVDFAASLANGNVHGPGITSFTNGGRVSGRVCNGTDELKTITLLLSWIQRGGFHTVLDHQTRTIPPGECRVFRVNGSTGCDQRLEAEFIWGGDVPETFQQGQGGFSLVHRLATTFVKWTTDSCDEPEDDPECVGPECDPKEPPCEEDCEPPCEEDCDSDDDSSDDSSDDDECEVFNPPLFQENGGSPFHRHNQFDRPIGNPRNECAVLSSLMKIRLVPAGDQVPVGYVTKCGLFYEFTSFAWNQETCHNGQAVSHSTGCRCADDSNSF